MQSQEGGRRRPRPSDRTALAADGYEVFKKYSGENGIKAEYEQAAADNPSIAKIVTIGKTVNGQDIIAMKLSKNARKDKDGKKPSVLYAGAQHAREWITPEMNRRLMHHMIDNYASDPKIKSLVDKNELWFVPVANPDGYDFTFEPDQRLWRKNLRDNNNDGEIAPGDGVDLNRNYQTKWGYDNEGSSPNTGSETYRGPSAASEPETKALNSFADRVGFEFLVNYHSAAQLLLYGTGWQVSTPTPDDVIYEAMAGDDENPAVPGYDPDISAELYTTNGDTDTHMTEAFGTLGFTPEMSTCEAASDSVPDDEWEAEDCQSGFNFPDDEELVQAEFEKNIPFALSVAESADDPDDPASVVDRTAADFQVDSFDVSYGDPQTVAVVAKRALKNLRLSYRINGGSAKNVKVSEWEGGERYGDENDDYYAEFRGQVKGAGEGDEVEVRFTGNKSGAGNVSSDPFTYTVASDSNDDVLVLADEDYTGVNPDYPASVTAPKYAAAYERGHQRRRLSRLTSGTSTSAGFRTTSACSATTRRSSGISATTGSPRIPRTRRSRRRSASCPTSRWPRRSSTRRWPSATTSTTAASSSMPARPRSTPVCPASATPSAACSTGSTVIPRRSVSSTPSRASSRTA